ncbi:uncharacterized protein LOC123015590 [Tribolium madens]|uniref:uncharacterized protein LOC123015590 n=1 Tax=Tribolium madens TaxID=41895 RepID=UPI001CF72897|nr:uncharacterized protein LOC123015590 [Tribolium madens]
MAKIILFNRRRVTEVAAMSLDLFKNRISLQDHHKQQLNLHQRVNAEQYRIMTLIGKRSHILHVLIEQEQCTHLEKFTELRNKAGVSDSNKYLFGIPSDVMYIDASNVLREFSFKCGATRPDLLRTTYLRKQVATLAQVLNLNDNQIAQVAALMGHSQKVHEQIYKQDDHLFQVTAWTKFLSIARDEDITSYKGKTFKEVLTSIENTEVPDVGPADENHFTLDELLNVEEMAVLETSTNIRSDTAVTLY